MPAPPPPPPPQFNSSGPPAGDNRSMLLQSIRAGKTLKKTVTVDKSAPVISGKRKLKRHIHVELWIAVELWKRLTVAKERVVISQVANV